MYQIGEGRRIGESRYFNVPVLVLRENDLHIQRPPVQLQAASDEAARILAIRHYERFAEQLEFDILITEISEKPVQPDEINQLGRFSP